MKTIIAKLRNSFLSGLLIILPAVLTIWLLYFIAIKLNNILLNPIIKIVRPYLQYEIAVFAAKFAVLIFSILFIALIGGMANYLITRRLLRLVEKLFLKLPMLNKVYSAIKEVSNAFLGQQQQFFKKVVLLEYPRKGLYSIGFITSETKGEVQVKTKEEVVNIFVPTTPNPTSGVLLLVPKHEVIILDMSIEAGLKLVVSGGAIVPPYRFAENLSGHSSLPGSNTKK
ncbi:MAG: DUF502 domain-containing protein [Candidatus Omnitrophota bacterium]